MTLPSGVMNYGQYNRQFVQPSAALHEELLRRFAVNVDVGAASFRLQSGPARPEPFAWLRPRTQMVPAPSYVGPILPDPPLPPGVEDVTNAVAAAARNTGVGPLRPQRSPTDSAPTFRAAPGGAMGPTDTRGYYGARGALGRLRGGQVQPSEMSDYDLRAEAEELGVGGAEAMPRPVLEKAVGAMRPARQAKNQGDGPLPGLAPESVMRSAAAGAIGMIESVQNAAEAWGLANPKYEGLDARGWLSTLFNQERNREALGKLKAKLRLSATETQAAMQDKSEALGEFVGPFFPQAGIWTAIKSTGKVAASAPVIGRSASWLFNGGLRGDIVAGVGTNLIWNSQFEMPWAPKAEDVENFLTADDPRTFLESGAAIVSTRVGNLLLDAGLGALLGRVQQRGAAATPAAAQPFVPPPTAPPGAGGAMVQGPWSGPPTIGPAGPLQTTPGALVSPSLGEVPLGFAGMDAAPRVRDPFGWEPPATTNVAADVAPDNMASPLLQVRSEPLMDGAQAAVPPSPSTPSRLTADELLTQAMNGEARWLDQIPVPRAGENEFPHWQNTVAARYARANGTVLAREDGSLIALFHEGSGTTEFSYAASADRHLSGPGAFFRDRADETYRDFSLEGGYGVKTMAKTMGQWERTNDMLENVSKQLDDLESAVRTSKKQSADVTRRIADLQEQRAMLASQLEEIGVPNAATHPVFAIVKRPYYFDAAMPRERMDELLEAVRTNPQFESLRPSLQQLDGKFDALYRQGPGGQTVEPLASQVHAALSQVWHTAENGSTQVIGPRGVNDLLKSVGYDAIHNIGGLRSRMAGTNVPTYNAWNLLDPENQIVRVFAPPPMASELAETTARQLTKQAAIMESSTLEQVAERAVISDVDVINANISKYPFGVQVIRGVRDPATVMQRLTSGAVGVEGVSPSSYRLVARELTPGGTTTFDVMVSTGRPITDDMAAQFQKHGVFSGMHGIVGAKGQQVEVVDVFTATGTEKLGARKLTPGETYLTVQSLDRPLHAGKGKIRKNVYTVLVNNFLEKRMTDESLLAQDPTLTQMVQDFVGYAEQRLGTDIEGILTVDSMRKLPVIFDEYAAAKGLPPASRSIMGGLVERELVDAARELAGPDLGKIDDAVREALDAVDTDAMDNVIQMASHRGLQATPEPGTARWILRGPRATQWVMEDESAARSFLRAYDAEARDLSPSGPVLPEVSRSYEPERLYQQGPSLEVQAEAAMSSAKLMENLMRDELGGRWGMTQGPAQPASALPYTPPPRTATPSRVLPPMQPPVNPAVALLTPGAPPPPPTVPPAATFGVPAGGAPIPPSTLTAQLQAASGNIARIRHDLENFVWQNVMPSRAFFDRMDELLEGAGAPILAPGQDMFNLRTAISRFYNTSADQIEVLTRTMNQFQSRTNRAGHVWKAVDSLLQPAVNVTSRAAYMAQHGFNSREIAAVNQLDQLGEQVAGPQAWQHLKAYTSIVNAQMIAGVPNPYAVPPQLAAQFSNIDFFMRHAARRQLRLEVPDAGTIMHEYMRAYHWEQEVAPLWKATQDKWRSVANWQDFRGERVMRPVAEYVLGWMDGVENGFLPQSDPLLNGIQWTLEKFGIPLNKRETMNLIGGTMSSAYRALLGWNPYSVLRDATQPLMATPWTGVDNLAAAYLEVSGAKGGAAQRAAWQAALDNGWTEKGIPPILAANVDQSAISAGLPLQQQQFTPAQEKIRELAQMASDFVRDMVPPALRSLEGTKLDPLWAYTQQGVVARVVVGNAAAKRFDEVLGKPFTVPQAILQLGAKEFSRAQSRHIEELLNAGKTTEARNVYANTVADMTMNRYGVKEGAIGNHMVLGRVGTQLGGHSSHQLAMFYNLGRSGVTSRTSVRMLMTIGAFTGAYKALEATTGWDWTKWHPLNWANSPQLGGPLLEPGGRALGAAAGAVAEGVRAATGQESDPYNTRMISDFLNRFPGDVARFGGTVGAGARFAGTYGRAAQESPEALGRLIFTGDRRDDTQYRMDSSFQGLYDYLNSGGTKGKGAQ